LKAKVEELVKDCEVMGRLLEDERMRADKLDSKEESLKESEILLKKTKQEVALEQDKLRLG